MSYLGRITFDPEQCSGRPCIRGYRIRVKDILEMLAGRARRVRKSSPTSPTSKPMTSLPRALRRRRHGPCGAEGRVKLLVDEHLPPALATWLREQGCEACREKRR